MSKRILVIDDEEHIRHMLRLTLEAAGYEVGEAQDGAEGVSRYGNGSNWSAVVLDQRMPGMDGLETLRRLKTINVNARVIMATAYASIELAVDAMKLGATDFVRKPMTPEVLRNSVEAALLKTTHDLPQESARAYEPRIPTITMNGFTILDDEEMPPAEEGEHRFLVTNPEGQKHHVVVEIDIEAVEFVERTTGRRLPPEGSFWTTQAQRVLTDYLWNERKVPPTGRLVLRNLAPDKLTIAARWRAEAGRA